VRFAVQNLLWLGLSGLGLYVTKNFASKFLKTLRMVFLGPRGAPQKS
jgi:hypothetical protein